MLTDKQNAATRPPPLQGKPTAAGQPSQATSRYARGERMRRLETWVPRIAVGMVAVSAFAAALLSTRFDAAAPTVVQQEQQQQPAVATAGASSPGADIAKVADKVETGVGVVTAPPLKTPVKAVTTGASPTSGPQPRAATSAMGGAPACRNCGVVETVVAVHGYAQAQPSGYQMHIRMDDGTVRTIEQRGALAAGSRVVVERSSVRVVADAPGQG